MLSDKLKKLRNSKTKLTQSEFAKKIDVARTTYAMYEQGNREPDYITLRKIADYYDVSIDYLLGRSDESPSLKHIQAGIPEEDYQALSSTQRQVIDYFLNSETLAFKERPEDLIEALPSLEAAYLAITEHKRRLKEKEE